MLAFEPLRLRNTDRHRLRSLSVHVRDHKRREFALADRTLEAHYGAFVFSQCRKPDREALQRALETPYGRFGQWGQVGAWDVRLYELGPESPPDDIDPRSPAVAVRHDGEVFYLLASGEMSSAELLRIADSLYA